MQPPTSEANESEFYFPPPDLINEAYIKDFDGLYPKTIQDPQGFWSERSRLSTFGPQMPACGWVSRNSTSLSSP